MAEQQILTPREVIGILWFFIAFNAVFLSIRLYLIITRPRVTVAAFASEACVFLAFFLFLLETSSTTSYQAMLIKYQNDPGLQLGEVEMYIAGLWLVKGSFLALYYDIFRALPPRIKKILQITTAYTVLSWFGNFLLPITYCRPLHLVWAIEGHCTSFRSLVGTNFPMVTNVTTDLLIMLIPVLVLRNLKLRKSEVAAIGFLLSLGFLTIIATLLRYTYVTKRNAQGKSGSPNLVTQAQIWSYAECCIALFAACLPAGRVLLGRRKGYNSSGGNSSRAQSNFSFKRNRQRQGARIPDTDREHGLVVLKSESFAVESTAELNRAKHQLIVTHGSELPAHSRI